MAGDLAQARALCEARIAASPSCADSHNILSVVYKEADELERAKEQVLEAIRLDGRNAKYYVNLGAICMNLKQEQEAIAALKKAISFNSVMYQPYLNLGQIYQERGDRTDARRMYEYAYGYSSASSPECLIKLTRLMIEQKDYAGAEALCARDFTDTHRPQSRLLLAELYKAQDNFDEAIRVLEEARQEFPDHTDIHKELVLFYLRKEQPEQAEIVIRDAIRAVPTAHECYNSLGGVLVARKQMKEAREAFDQAIALKPGFMDAHYNKADTLLQLNNSDAAIAVLKECFDLEPHKDAWHMKCGHIYFHEKRLDEAVEQYNLAIAANPDNVDAYAELGRCWVYEGNIHKASAALEEGLKHDPDHVTCLVNSALVHSECGRNVRANKALARALELDPENLEGQGLKASFHISKGEYAEAEAIFDGILARRPRYSRAVAGKAVVYEKQKRFAEAREQFERVEKEALQSEVALTLSYALVLQRLKETEKAIDMLKTRIEDTEHRLAPRQRMPLLFNLASAYDKVGEYDKAWACYHEANQSRKVIYASALDDKRLKNIREVFTPEKLRNFPVAKNDSDLPVYIVGMPRSGTSLTEQIFDSHSAVQGAGELDFMGKITIRMSQMVNEKKGYPRIVEELTPRHVQGFSDKLMEKMREFSPDAKHVTDKMPHNFTMLGLIQLLVPKAKVIHLNRHPIDNCLSCYFQNFASGHEYSFRLDMLAHHYVTYRKIMEHWKSVVSLPIFDLPYEGLVEQPEPWVRKMLDHVGLEFEPGCLEFHKSDRAIQTASYDQVRQPLYTKSAGRWKHYEKHIGPLIEGLDSLL